MALKALDQRLANPAQNPGGSAPLPQSSHDASSSSHHPPAPAHDLSTSHSHPPRQNGVTPPQTIGQSTTAPQQGKPGSGSTRGEEPDEEADLGVTVEKSAKGSVTGTHPT